MPSLQDALKSAGKASIVQIQPSWIITARAARLRTHLFLLSVKFTLRKLHGERFDTLGHLPGQFRQLRILFQ